jgi:hypothetical protein
VIEVIKNVLYLASGVAIGYFLAYRQLEKSFDERLYREVDDARIFYRTEAKRKTAENYVSDPEFFEQAVRAAEALKVYEGVTIQEPVTEEEEPPAEEGDKDDPIDVDQWAQWSNTLVEEPEKPKPPVSILSDETTGAVNYNAISTTSKDKVIAEELDSGVEVIEKQPFIDGDSGFDQTTVTYFVGDDMLANDHDQVISLEARELFLGSDIFNLLKADPEARGGEDVVYVRNSQRKREFEIIVNSDSYSNIVGDIVYASSG